MALLFRKTPEQKAEAFKKFYAEVYPRIKDGGQASGMKKLAVRVLHPKRFFASKMMESHENFDCPKMAAKQVLLMLPDLVFVMSKDTTILSYYSGNRSELYAAPEDFLGKKMTDILPADVTKKIAIAAGKVALGKQTECYYWLEAPNGKKQHYHLKMSLGTDERLYAAVREDTHAHNMVDALRLTTHKFSAVFKQAPVAMALYGEEGALSETNQEYMRMFGVDSLNDVAGINLFRDSNVTPEMLSELKEGKDISYDLELNFDRLKAGGFGNLKKSGKLWINVRARMVNTVAAHGYVAHITDITGRKNVEHELQRLNGEKDRFVSIFAHDLKSPFHGLLGYLEFLKEDLNGLSKEEIRKIVDVFEFTVKKIFALIEKTLEWNRVSGGRIELKPKNCDAKLVAQGVCDVMGASLFKKGVTIENAMPAGLCAYADEYMFGEILHNLVSNAIKFTEKGGKITLSASREGTAVHFTVSDTGVGMPPEKLAQLFRLNLNASTKGTSGENGTGLGLNIVKEMVEKNNGEVGVESEVGVGTVFTITLPAQAPEKADG